MGMIMVVSMVFVVIMMVVVQFVAGFKITLSSNTLSQKHINWQFAHGSCDHLHTTARGLAQSVNQSFGFSDLQQVSFVHHNHIGAGDLIFEKL